MNSDRIKRKDWSRQKMTDQNTFMEVVNNVAEIVRTAEMPMSEEEILAYFSDMDLDDSQKNMVLNYIMTAESREQEEAAKLAQETEENAKQASQDEIEEEPKSKVFQMYLDELAGLPFYSAADRMALYDKLVSGDDSVIEQISNAWLKKVLTIAEKYIEPKLVVEDLVQEGNMALFLKLQELLGSGRAEDVEELLSAAVEEGIMSYCSMMSGERELENTLVGKISLVHEAKKILTMEKGQEPTLEELADYTKMSVEELADLDEVMKE